MFSFKDANKGQILKTNNDATKINEDEIEVLLKNMYGLSLIS